MKKLAPKDARTTKRIRSLRSDNYSTRDGWILLDGGTHISIAQQRQGEGPKGHVSIPRTQFNRMVEWYLKEQATTDKSSGVTDSTSPPTDTHRRTKHGA